MRVFLGVVLISVGSLAAPTPSPFDITFTPAIIDSICKKLEDPKYKQYMAEWIVQPVCSMSEEGKQQLADYINNFHACKYTVPHTRDAVIALLKEHAPIVAKVFEDTLAKGIEKWKQLDDGASKFVAKWENMTYQNLECDRLTMFVNFASTGKEFIADANALTPANWESMKSQFPEFVDAWNNMPNLQAAKALLEKLPDDYDFRGDVDTMGKLCGMMLKDFFPSNSTQEAQA